MAEELRLEPVEGEGPEPETLGRRDFLLGLKKWSAVVIGGAVQGAFLAQDEAQAGAWVNGRGVYGGGGAWVNGAGGGGGAWVNGRGGGGAWVNRRY
jgi:hypothetical protein